VDPAAIVMIVVAGTVGVFSVPIVWMLTSHQRKMAQIIQQSQDAGNSDAVANELRELKQVVCQQAIALDSLTSEVRRSLPPTATQESLSNRLG
jgi:hypothetical protein